MNDKALKFPSLVWASAVLILTLAMPSVLSAQTLSEVYRVAKREDMQYRAALKSYDAALEKLPQARAGLLPVVNVSGNSSSQSGLAQFAGAAYVNREVQSWTWNAQITQPLIRWSTWVGYSQAGFQIEQAAAQLALAEQDVLLRSAQAFFDFMLAQENIRVSEAQLHAVNEQLLLAERNYAVGTGIITDVYEAKAKKSLTVAQRIAAVNELASKQAELDKILGEPMALQSVRLTQSLPTVAASQLNDGLNQAMRNNPQVRVQVAALEVAKKEVTKSQSAHAPTLDLTYSRVGAYSSGSLSSPADLETRSYANQAGLQLTVPLYAGGATQSKVRESLILRDKADDELQGARRSATAQVRQAFAGVMNGQAQIEALQDAVDSGVQAVEANKIGFKIGTRINPEVLNAEQQLYGSMRDLMKARVDAVMQSLKLKAAMGTVQDQDLQALEALLLPTP